MKMSGVRIPDFLSGKSEGFSPGIHPPQPPLTPCSPTAPQGLGVTQNHKGAAFAFCHPSLRLFMAVTELQAPGITSERNHIPKEGAHPARPARIQG